ncbi:MAG: UvrD-helicase domain-containing protein [Rhodococcus sp. (in: high G+C Gram-positive bacteria)]|uniref:UvrD-helicase domain-containing protein n=1 Tax=Rhodococcus sp. TaxID=1831 RepID=UPI003BB0B2E7
MTTTFSPDIDLTTISRGSVTAPAGFGKTQVIAGTIAQHPEQRFLVLTHTNAGVRSLHDRITKFGAHRAARIETISGFALRLARAFPTGIGWSEESGIDHLAALAAAQTIVRRPTVRRALFNSYDWIIVDEYQDCSVVQHEIISHLADHIHTVVLGDPLQAIFGFANQPVISWPDVQSSFPPAGTLHTPHRWTTTNIELGQWLKSIRAPLNAGRPITRPSPASLEVRRLTREIHEGALHSCINDGGHNALLIPDSARDDQIARYAKTISRRAVVHEAAEQPDLLAFVDTIADGRAPDVVLLKTIAFAVTTTTKVASPQVITLRKNLGSKGQPGSKVNDLNALARRFIETQGADALAEFIGNLTNGEGRVTYRPGLLNALLAALRALGAENLTNLADAARKSIDARRRIAPTPTTRCSVGSTLRVKGLEYDRVIIVDPARVPSREHLYVALSRARRKITLAIPPGGQIGEWFVHGHPN